MTMHTCTPTFVAYLVAIWAVSMGLVAWQAYEHGRDSEISTQAREERAAIMAADVAASAAAAAIYRLSCRRCDESR